MRLKIKHRVRNMHALKIAVDVLLALLSGVMYSMARQSKVGLCKLACAGGTSRVVPCFVGPVQGCVSQQLETENNK